MFKVKSMSLITSGRCSEVTRENLQDIDKVYAYIGQDALSILCASPSLYIQWLGRYLWAIINEEDKYIKIYVIVECPDVQG